MKVLEISNVSVDFDGYKAISNLDFFLNKDEVRIILGPNGAGKTTLMDIITGSIKPNSGQILFHKQNITGMAIHEISKLGIGRKFQGPHVFNDMTVFENLEVSVQSDHKIFKSIFKKYNTSFLDRINEILKKINLSDKVYDYARSLSHGEKQWLEMGMILAQDPELVILDEPTTGMTADETFKTGELIQTVFKGKSVIVIEHDMNFVKQIAKLVTVLHQGKILAEGALSEIENNQKVQEVYLREDQ